MYRTKEETSRRASRGGQAPAGSRIDVSHTFILSRECQGLLGPNKEGGLHG